MPISIDPSTCVISVPQSYLTALGGDIYELDVNQFRLDLKDWEDSEVGVSMPDTHKHTTSTTMSGVTYARFVEILFPYTITFEDVGTPYTVKCVGANHNIGDRKNVNQVSLIIGNSAGLIEVATGAGPSAAAIAGAVWDEALAAHTGIGSAGEALLAAAAAGGLTPTQAQQLTEMYQILGLDLAFEAKHGKTYIKVPADGSLIHINVTKAGSGATQTTTLKRQP